MHAISRFLVALFAASLLFVGGVHSGAALAALTTPTSDFPDNGDGTVTDNATGLMWEKKDNSGGIHDKDNTYSWSTGTDNMDGTIKTGFLATLNAGSGFAGHTDWRVPNRFELTTLVDLGVGTPDVHSAFDSACIASCTLATCSCTRAGLYWTSSTYSPIPTGAWLENFSDGDTTANLKTEAHFARAVRAGS